MNYVHVMAKPADLVYVCARVPVCVWFVFFSFCWKSERLGHLSFSCCFSLKYS